jgi:hypothetical protein
VKNPLKLVSRRAPKIPTLAIPALPAVPLRTRRIAALSTACAVVVSVGAGSAMFVDYLADRAMARAADSAPAPAIRQIRIASDSTVATDSETETVDAEPTVRPPEIVVAAPAPIAAPSENAIEVPLDDPTAKPILHLDQIETASLEDTGDAAYPEVVPAVANDDPADSTDIAAIPEAEIKPRKQNTAAVEPNSSQADTKLAALPGVDVGGLAGHPASESTGASRQAQIVKSVNLRASGQKGAKVLGVVPAGTTVSLFGCTQWCEVSYNGRRGWVYKTFVGASQSTATKTKTTENQASASDASDGRRVTSMRAQ